MSDKLKWFFVFFL